MAAGDAARLSNIRYKGGVTSYLEVLDSERQFFDAELGLVRSNRDELLAIVRLYKALGRRLAGRAGDPGGVVHRRTGEAVMVADSTTRPPGDLARSAWPCWR